MSKFFFVAAALSTVVFATNPSEAQTPSQAGIAVSFRDLDLHTEQGRAELMGRLISASEQYCSEHDTKTIAEHNQCIRTSLADALAHASPAVQVAMSDTSVTVLARR